MVEVGLKCVVKEPVTSRCIILLESLAGLEVLPIPVGDESANFVQSCLCGKGESESLSLFKLISELISELDNAFPERVVVDGYTEGVFSAKVYLIINGEERCIDARPSDAVLFSMYAKVPVYVAKALLAEKFKDKKLCFMKNSKCTA